MVRAFPRRRRVAIVGAALATAWVARAAAAREDFVVVERTVVVPGLDLRHDGLVVAQLTDLHLGLSTPTKRVRRAIAAINAAAPDLVVLTGDYATMSRRPVKRIGEAVAGLTAPTFAVLGNHDHWVAPEAVREQLEGQGYTVLQNASSVVTLRGAAATVIGVDDEQVGRADVAKAFTGIAAEGTRVVLAHQPKTADQLPEDSGLVCFSGHTHGGQIVLPRVTEAIARGVGQRYLKGLYRVRGNWLFVSGGIGYGSGGPALRLHNPPEIAFVTLRAG